MGRMTSGRTPARLGYRMPAEWEPHEATWLAWPRREGAYAFEAAVEGWCGVCRALAPRERVRIMVFDEAHEGEAREALARAGLEGHAGRQIHFHRLPATEPQVRDHGPAFVVGEDPPRTAVVGWDAMGKAVAEDLGMPWFEPGMILGGGAVDVNGRGCALASASLLCGPNGNPPLSRAEVEARLKDSLAVERVIWLEGGIAGDMPGGRVDAMARFVARDTVVVAVESDDRDENFAPLIENYRRVLEARDAQGREFRVCTLPMPDALRRDGRRLAASYANFYIANKVVLMPRFGQPNDGEAAVTLRELFPGREVVGLECVDWLPEIGGLHGITQPQPAV